MTRVVVTGSSGRLGSRVVRLLGERDDPIEVVGIDLRPGHTDHGDETTRTVQADLVTAELAPLFEGADAVLHLASVFGPTLMGNEIDMAVEVALARRVLDAAAKASVGQVVLMSSATVYGPWPNNPVPLTEDAPLRPHPDLELAVQKGEVERLAWEWAGDHPGATVATLRPVTVVQDDSSGWLARALDDASGVPAGDDPPMQYLHIDDLATAVVAVWAKAVAGPVNVAPEGWLTPTERQALDPVPKVRLPERVALSVAGWRWRLGLAATTPGIMAYARHPWVVANDRLAATGWTASHSNEEAYVVGHEASAIESISPQRRQELALGVAGGVIAAGAATAVALVRRSRRRR